ncbi:MAG: sigma-70 family RNA polymerase sigma factor [Lacunisphaera sp.]
MKTDHELLHDYLTTRSDAAFSALVQRYVHLVYSTAVRQVSSPDFANEVSQQVFLELAASARRLRPDTHLSSWLYVVTSRRAIDLVRREARRVINEAAVAAQNAIDHSEEVIWPALRPLLDDVMGELNDREREAVVRRFFENEGFRDIGAAMGVSEDTAQKRVSRALDRLRELLTKRGVVAGATALASALSAHAVEFAPPGLGKSITHAAAQSFILTTPLAISQQLTAAIGRTLLTAAALTAVIGLLYLVNIRQTQEAEIYTLRGERSRWVEAIPKERIRQAATAAAAVSAPADPVDIRARTLAARIRRLHDWLELVPEDALPRMALLTDFDWIVTVENKPELDDYEASFSAQSTAVEDVLFTLDDITTQRFGPHLWEAFRRYRKATGKQTPGNLTELLPYFKVPVDPTFLYGYSMKPPNVIAYWRSSQLSGNGRGGSNQLPPE